MKITVELTMNERLAIGNFLESIGLEESAESITKETDQCGAFRITNKIGGLTGNYAGTAECEENYILDTIKVLQKYTPLADAVVSGVKSVYASGKLLFEGIIKDIGDVISKYEYREPYGSFADAMNEKEVNNHEMA